VDRKEFIRFWANYVKTHKDKEWSKQQKKLIDSQIKSSREFLKKNPKIAEILLRKIRQTKQ
jgi:hypothetical protein